MTPKHTFLKKGGKKNKAEIKNLNAYSGCIMVVGQWLIFSFSSTMKYSYPHSVAVRALVGRAPALASNSWGGQIRAWPLPSWGP